jgi:PAS domain S-box-containing protein
MTVLTMQLHLPAAVDVSEQALEEVFRHTPVGVVLSDLHGTILDANLAFCSMLVRDRTAVIGRAFFGLVHPEETGVAERGIDSLRREEVSSIESVRRWLASDGRVVTTKVTASIVRSRNGEPICGIAFVEDIGERLAIETALRESETRYRRVVEDQTELIVRCTPDGTRTFVNEAYCRYSEAPAADLIGTSFFPCIPADEQELVRHKYESLTPERPVATDEHRVFTPRGVLRAGIAGPIAASSTPRGIWSRFRRSGATSRRSASRRTVCAAARKTTAASTTHCLLPHGKRTSRTQSPKCVAAVWTRPKSSSPPSKRTARYSSNAPRNPGSSPRMMPPWP